MLPKDVAHESRRSCDKSLPSHGTNIFSSQLEGLQSQTFQREFSRGPTKPVGYVHFAPLTGICKHTQPNLYKQKQIRI